MTAWLVSWRQSCAAFTNMSVCLFVTGDGMNNFLNENFLIIIQELAQPTFNAMAMLTHQALLSWMEKVPYDELFTDN